MDALLSLIFPDANLPIPTVRPLPTTSSLPPKMVIAKDHSYAKNWEDLAFSPWNAQPQKQKPLVKVEPKNDDSSPLTTNSADSNCDAVFGLEQKPEIAIPSNENVLPPLIPVYDSRQNVIIKKEEFHLKEDESKSIIAKDCKDVVNGVAKQKIEKKKIEKKKVIKSQKLAKKVGKKEAQTSSSNETVLAKVEVQGLRSLLEFLHKPGDLQDVPESLKEPRQLLEEGWKIVMESEKDVKINNKLHGVTGLPNLRRWDHDDPIS
jgi:hypothetical protein